MGYNTSPENLLEDRSGGTFGPLNLSKHVPSYSDVVTLQLFPIFDLDTGIWGRLLDLFALVGWFAASSDFGLENLDLT